MSKEKLNIEELFKQQFEHFEVQPSERVWKGVSSNLFRRHFMQFNLNSFNIYYLSAIIIAGTISVITLIGNRTAIKEPFIQNQIAIESPGNNVPDAQAFTKEDKVVPASPDSKTLQKNTVGKNKPAKTESQSDQVEIITIPNIPLKTVKEKEQKSDNPNTPYLPNQIPLTYFSISTREGCAPLAVNFTNQSENATAYSWSFGDGGVSSEKNPSYIFDEPGTYFVNLSVTAAGGEISVYTDSIHVYPLPDIHFNFDAEVVPGSGQPVYFYNYSKGADYFVWNFGDGNSSNQKEPSHYYEKAGNYDITLMAESIYGCRDSMVLKNAFAEKAPVILFPNVFSPNRNGPSDGYYSPNDSRNDVFHPVIKENIAEYQLKIFNRNGLLIFESNDINIGWDGYFHQGLMPQGVYIWKVRGRFANGRSFVKMGDVTLIWTQQR